MKKKSIVTLIIILLICVMFFDFKINGVNVIADYFRSMETESMKKLTKLGRSFDYDRYVSADKKLTFKKDAATINKLKMINKKDILFSTAIIKGEKRESINIEYKVTVYADKSEQADEFIKKVKLDQEIKNQTLLLEFKYQNNPDFIKRIKVNYDIRVPKEIVLDIINQNGKLKVNNINQDIIIENARADTVVNNIGGKANLKVAYGKLFVEKVKGKTRIESNFNKTTVKNIEDNAEINSRYSAVEIDEIAGNLKIESKFGGVVVNDIAGDLNISSKYAGITVSAVKGDIKAEAKFGETNFKNVNNNLNFTGKHADIDVKLSSSFNDYTLFCKTENEDIRSNIELPVNSKGEIKEMKGTVGKGTSKINIITENGDIFINQ